jgi:hypothetical protein
MSRRLLRWVPAGSLCLAAALSAACDSSSPAAPTARPPTPGAPGPATAEPPRVWAVSPVAGSPGGATPVLISGTGFRSGASVSLGGAATNVNVTSSTELTATTTAHTAGLVDLVVTNPDGKTGRLEQAYTFAAVMPGPAPLIISVSPAVGTIEAGGTISVHGVGFQPGSIVKLDETQLRAYTEPGGLVIRALASAHAPGDVDVVVINPDGQSARVQGGYRYAAPGTLDFSGEWKGIADDRRDNHNSTAVRLTIERNRVVSVTCNAQLTLLAPAAEIIDDRFSFSADNRLLVSGRFQSAVEVTGTIDIPPCGSGWGARRE